jgi:transcriptional/translational regulatory protein YebC/TACO1
VEMLAKNQDIASSELKHKMKKIGGAFEKNLLNMFDKKGIVTARAPEQSTVEN